MKKLLFVVAALVCSYASHAQTDVPNYPNNNPMGGGSWLRFTTGGDASSIIEHCGITISGSNIQPVKIRNASLLVGYGSNCEDFGQGNALISGNVGIGTTTPQSSLHINSNGTSANAASEYSGNLIVQGNSGGRSTTNGSSLEFVVPASTDGSNPWGQARIITVAGNANNNDATGKLILGTRRMFDKGVGTGYTWNYGDDMAIDGNGNIGIGNTAPQEKLDVNLTTNTEYKSVGMFTNQGTNSTNSPIGGLRFNWYNGNLAEIQMVRGYGGSDGAGLSFHTSFNNGGTFEAMRLTRDGKLAIGTTDPKGYKLAVAGDAIAQTMTVKLQGDWSDYVFDKGYHLPDLKEVKAYVDKNHHLPEVPSAGEVADKGINLGEMNKLLTKKVEELTLYLIEKDKETKDLSIRIKRLESQIPKIK